jgi:surface antigen
MLKKHLNIRLSFLHNTIGRRVACSVVGMAALAVMLLASGFGPDILSASASAPCGSGDTSYIVNAGDTLSAIALQHGTNYQALASHNQIANPNLIFVGQQICIPTHAASVPATSAISPLSAQISSNVAVGTGNFFAYGQCTYWANARYHQLHGVYVPWRVNANAYQWVSDAYAYHWRVSSVPTVGAIMQLDPGVQGASGYGHVAVVESIQSNGRVVASSMNWNGLGSQVSYWTFTPGAGVHFITY